MACPQALLQGAIQMLVHLGLVELQSEITAGLTVARAFTASKLGRMDHGRMAVRGYGAPPRLLDEFLAGYGLEASGWPGFEILVQGYELWTTAWAVSNRGQSAQLEDEAEVRLDRWRPGHRFPRPWALR